MRRLLALVFVLSASLSIAQTLPPAPATVAEAVRQANDLAYGYPKNTVEYWNSTTPPYYTDREYFWKRMLGWQAEGGPDQASYGLYAVPPSPWRQVAPVPVPAPPAPSVDLSAVLSAIEGLKAQIGALTFPACVIPPPPVYKGSLWGLPITLRPEGK